MIEFDYKGEKIHLYLNGAAHFAAMERYKDKPLLDVIEPDTTEGYEATIWLCAELSRQGELYRRYLGEDAGRAISYQQLLASAQPKELPLIKAAVIAAICDGYRTEQPDENEGDPWLQEFEAMQAKKKHCPKRGICARLRRAWACLCGTV